ncbi:hypothetical protein [Methanocella conradii]|nr:hypothetical protein [Methanocella conradii]MDI6896509.1 hypothetical protein [Methanocella conradii]
MTAIMLVGALASNAYAQAIVSGSIPFDPDNLNGVKSAANLTIYAIGPGGAEIKVNPDAYGNFSMILPGNGTYSFRVEPSKLDYLNKTTNASYSIFYPDGTANVFIKVVPDQGLKNVTIPAMKVAYPTISGTIPFDPGNYNNVTSVTDLTIYAINESGFSVRTNPNPDGTFSMDVVGSGKYSFRVIPSRLDYVDKSTDMAYSIQYPDATNNKFTVNVPDEGIKNLTIKTWKVMTGVPTATPTAIPAGTPTPKPSPGFTMLAALAMLGAAVATMKKL